jgi:ribose transport system permease protein
VKERFADALRSQVIGPFLIMLTVAAGVAISTDRFLLSQNLKNVALQASIVAIVAIGATIVILTAQIDLSSGSLVALTTVQLADLVKNAGVSVAVAAVLMILMGAGLGFVNGFFSSYGRIPSFIFTLGTLSIFRGLAFLDTGGTPIFSVSPQLDPIFYGELLGLPLPFVYVIVLYTLAWAYLTHTPRGRQIYAVGGNESAARLSGINVNRVRTEAFVIAGALAAVGGVLLTARLDSGSPNYGQGMELMAIASAVIGGASLFGGTGRVVATESPDPDRLSVFGALDETAGVLRLMLINKDPGSPMSIDMRIDGFTPAPVPGVRRVTAVRRGSTAWMRPSRSATSPGQRAPRSTSRVMLAASPGSYPAGWPSR